MNDPAGERTVDRGGPPSEAHLGELAGEESQPAAMVMDPILEVVDRVLCLTIGVAIRGGGTFARWRHRLFLVKSPAGIGSQGRR